jgi:hypothetical protein
MRRFLAVLSLLVLYNINPQKKQSHSTSFLGGDWVQINFTLSQINIKTLWFAGRGGRRRRAAC